MNILTPQQVEVANEILELLKGFEAQKECFFCIFSDRFGDLWYSENRKKKQVVFELGKIFLRFTKSPVVCEYGYTYLFSISSLSTTVHRQIRIDFLEWLSQTLKINKPCLI